MAAEKISDDGIDVLLGIGIGTSLIALILVGLVSYESGKSHADKAWRIEAVEAGHAEYITQDGTPVWQWRKVESTNGGER